MSERRPWGVRVVTLLIGLYQHTISPDHGWLRRWRSEPFCALLPTCSEYAREAVACYGVRRGGALTFDRLRRCGRTDAVIDPVPDRHSSG